MFHFHKVLLFSECIRRITVKPSYDFGQVSTDDEAVFASASLWVKHDKENREKYFYENIFSPRNLISGNQ